MSKYRAHFCLVLVLPKLAPVSVEHDFTEGAQTLIAFDLFGVEYDVCHMYDVRCTLLYTYDVMYIILMTYRPLNVSLGDFRPLYVFCTLYV